MFHRLVHLWITYQTQIVVPRNEQFSLHDLCAENSIRIHQSGN